MPTHNSSPNAQSELTWLGMPAGYPVVRDKSFQAKVEEQTPPPENRPASALDRTNDSDDIIGGRPSAAIDYVYFSSCCCRRTVTWEIYYPSRRSHRFPGPEYQRGSVIVTEAIIGIHIVQSFLFQ